MNDRSNEALIRECKAKAAEAAADLVVDGAVVGLGSGSTLAIAIKHLAQRCREGLRITAAASSLQARLLAVELGIPMLEIMDVSRVDVTLDGADEIDEAGNLIKGGGAAHTTEKVLAAMADRFVVVVDQSKCVQRLGSQFPVPIEVVVPALASVRRRLEALGARVVLRTGSGKIGPVISDLGHPLLDAQFGPIADPAELDRRLSSIPGIVGHGLFIGMADHAIIGAVENNRPTIHERQLTRFR